MSLLMEALKKAEQAKKNAAGGSEPPPSHNDSSEVEPPPEKEGSGAALARDASPQWEIDTSVDTETAAEPSTNATATTAFPAIEWELPSPPASATSALAEETPETIPEATPAGGTPSVSTTSAAAPLALDTPPPATPATAPSAPPPQESPTAASTAIPAQKPMGGEAPPSAARPSPPPQGRLTLANELTALQRLARTVFDAKRHTIPPIRYLLIGVALIGAAAAVGGAMYFWQAWSQLHAIQPPWAFTPPRPAPVPRAVTPPPTSEAPAANATGPAAAPATTPPPSTTPAAIEKIVAETARPTQPPPTAPRSATAPSRDFDSLEQTTPTGPIDIQRSEQAPRLDSRLLSAYHAFMKKDIALAQREYAAVLKRNPNNRDALLGMAAIAVRQHHPRLAARRYLHLLALDPQDATAQAGLTTLSGQSDPVANESRLQGLLAQHPRSPYLYFALGGLYAAQSRWPEAQQAFFNALRHDTGNPDILYNLAVSLDHLGQPRLALSYYRQALDNARRYPANFDAGQLRRRIAKLTRFTASTGGAGGTVVRNAP